MSTNAKILWPSETDDFVSVADVAKLLFGSRPHVVKLHEQGKLKRRYKTGNSRFVMKIRPTKVLRQKPNKLQQLATNEPNAPNRGERLMLAAQIQQHYLRNEDWPHEELLTQCGALTRSQAPFFSLQEKVLHPVTRRDAEQAELAAAIGHALKRNGFAVRQTSVESGYAIYSVVCHARGWFESEP